MDHQYLALINREGIEIKFSAGSELCSLTAAVFGAILNDSNLSSQPYHTISKLNPNKNYVLKIGCIGDGPFGH